MEFLMGRTLTNTMINLEMSSVVEEALYQVGTPVSSVAMTINSPNRRSCLC